MSFKTLPGRYYTDADVFREELETFYFGSWICAGRADAIPSVGDYFLREIGAESIVIVRDTTGAVRAHYNVCRHAARACAWPRKVLWTGFSAPIMGGLMLSTAGCWAHPTWTMRSFAVRTIRFTACKPQSGTAICFFIWETGPSRFPCNSAICQRSSRRGECRPAAVQTHRLRSEGELETHRAELQ